MAVGTTSSGADIVLGLGALATAVTLVRSWRTFWRGGLTAADRHLATQIAVFLIPPVVVLLHELGHIAAAVAVGAHPSHLHYGLFEGSVRIEGNVTPGQDWFIALAGNLVSALIGVGLMAVGAGARRLGRPLRYVLLVGGLVEVVFALIGYPLFSLSTNFGDWVVIYDFSATPGLAWATAAVHVIVLLGLWRWWRRHLRPLLFAVAHGEEDRMSRLEARVRRTPADAEGWLELASLFASGSDLGLAAVTLDRAVAAGADEGRLQLARARVALYRNRWNEAMMAADRGLRAPSANGELAQRLWANRALALTLMERPDNALAAFAHVTGPVASDPRVLYGRGVARLAAGDTVGGRADLGAVVDRLPANDLLRRWAEARLAGTSLAPADDSHLPAYQRGSRPPPAPIAGV